MGKKLISFLGTGDYLDVIYYINKVEINKSIKSRFTQEALVNILGKDVEVIMCLTELAKSTNWIDRPKFYGLEPRFLESNVNYRALAIKDGKDNSEIWANFDAIYDIIEENDELYIDITHSFRSIPVVIMSVINFAKEMKNIKIKGIYYGAYEVREVMKINGVPEGIAPLFNLNLFNDLTEWSKAAEKFLTTGDSRVIAKEIKDGLMPIVKNNGHMNVKIARELNNKVPKLLAKHSENLLSCRGRNVIQDGNELKNKLHEFINTEIEEIKPFSKVVEKLYESVQGYSGKVIEDFLYSVDLCNEYGLIQQGFTFLQETIITLFTMELGFNYNDREQRETSTRILTAFIRNDSRLSQEEIKLKDKLDSKVFTNLSVIYNEITDYRNDLNHAGFRPDMHKYEDFQNRLMYYKNKFNEAYTKYYNNEEIKINNKKAIVILSHKLNENQLSELREKWKVGEIIEIKDSLKEKWGNISPVGEIDNEFLNEVTSFILDNSQLDDYIVIQGEFGATYFVVNKCFQNKRIPIYATSYRNVEELVDGSITKTERVFQHVSFRRYIR